MTARRALVLVGGRIKELPAADTLDGAASGGTGFAPDEIDAADSLTVPAKQQMVLVGSLLLAGEIIVEGTLAIL